MNNPDESPAWIERAEEDYAIARSALRRKLPLTYIACFHAQQCAEKYLKALLVSRGQSFPIVEHLKKVAWIIPGDFGSLRIRSCG
jgi:HEPN domain-containing protein